jgi:hypothetical protein
MLLCKRSQFGGHLLSPAPGDHLEKATKSHKTVYEFQKATVMKHEFPDV